MIGTGGDGGRETGGGGEKKKHIHGHTTQHIDTLSAQEAQPSKQQLMTE